jgi:DNA replication and repair protein RecF
LDPDRTPHAHVVALRRLELEEFRLHRSFNVDVPAAGLRIFGPNGSGKSTLIEAIQLLATTRGRRGSLDGDLIHHESGLELGVSPYARVVGLFERDDTRVTITAVVQRGEGRSATRKTFKIGDRARRSSDVVGVVPTVSFTPDDLELVSGSPAVRRRFLDILLSQGDRQYLRCLSRYARILSQRNGLLRQAAEAGSYEAVADQFSYWDEQFVALGSYLVSARIRAVNALCLASSRWFQQLAEDAGALQVTYESTVHAAPEWWTNEVIGARDTTDAAQRIGVLFERQLRRVREAELARGATTVGPHRDDVRLQLASRELARFGSRGQQRIAVVAIKLAELDVISKLVGFRPVFLLDDVLSELDIQHRLALLQVARSSHAQLIVTSTDREVLDIAELSDLDELRLPLPEPDGTTGV